MESRVSQAVETFESGYTCAQAVFVTYAGLFGMDRETALKLSSPMGGGVGRMREICGAVSSMALLAGLKEGNTDPENEEGRERIYVLVRRLADRFKEKNGSIICRELLGITQREESAKPAPRTKEYYASRPCSALVASAAEIVEEMLLED
ncbi:hypothetical protein IMSAGC019_02422 [Lachnospiraceae bacterium]|nr:hypothetical protein IMSAGC019_02422 [Lachnospiraceae bacterium]